MMEGISNKINISLFIHKGNKLAGAKEMLIHLALMYPLLKFPKVSFAKFLGSGKPLCNNL